MKKSILIFAAALVIGVTAANAQDTTKNPSKSTQQTPQQSSSDQMKKDKTSMDRDANKVDANRSSDRTLVRPSEIPASLRQSLQGPDYTGWENGRVYKTKNGEYLLETKKDGMNKTHRFDANGKPIKE